MILRNGIQMPKALSLWNVLRGRLLLLCSPPFSLPAPPALLEIPLKAAHLLLDDTAMPNSGGPWAGPAGRRGPGSGLAAVPADRAMGQARESLGNMAPRCSWPAFEWSPFAEFWQAEPFLLIGTKLGNVS